MSVTIQARMESREIAPEQWAAISIKEQTVALEIVIKGCWTWPNRIGEAGSEFGNAVGAGLRLPEDQEVDLCADGGRAASGGFLPGGQRLTAQRSAEAPGCNQRVGARFLTQHEIDARESGWEHNSNSTNALMARALRGSV